MWRQLDLRGWQALERVLAPEIKEICCFFIQAKMVADQDHKSASNLFKHFNRFKYLNMLRFLSLQKYPYVTICSNDKLFFTPYIANLFETCWQSLLFNNPMTIVFIFWVGELKSDYLFTFLWVQRKQLWVFWLIEPKIANLTPHKASGDYFSLSHAKDNDFAIAISIYNYIDIVRRMVNLVFDFLLGVCSFGQFGIYLNLLLMLQGIEAKKHVSGKGLYG